MDAGVGEAMAISALIGAGVGGATSAATGQDPLKGALIGGIGGAVTGGAMGAFGGAGTAATESGLAAASTEATQVGETAAQQAMDEALKNGATQEQANMMAQSAREYASNTAGNATMGYQAPGTGVGGGGGSITAPPPSVPGGGLQPTGGIAGAQSAATNTGGAFSQPLNQNAGTFGQGFMKGISDNSTAAMVGGAGILGLSAMNADKNKYGVPATEHYTGPLTQFKYNPNTYRPTYPTPPNPAYTAQYAQGGIAQLQDQDKNFAAGGMYPMSQQDHTQYATSPQTPMSMQATQASYDPETNPLTGEPTTHMAAGGIAGLLKGRGDGMSDSIHATIADKQPARLADGEFVVPADVVSHLGNGSTDAGAKHLYKMMDKVRQARTGSKKQGKQIAAGGYLPA